MPPLPLPLVVSVSVAVGVEVTPPSVPPVSVPPVSEHCQLNLQDSLGEGGFEAWKVHYPTEVPKTEAVG